MKYIFSKLARYFIQGMLWVTPITITFYIIYNAINFVDHLLPVHFPGLNLIIIFGSITLLGAFGSSIILRPFINYFDRLMEKAPLVKVIYTSIKDLLSAFVGKEKKFNQPVLITIDASNEIYRIGFITQKSLIHVGLEEKYITVYVPHSYNFSGNLIIASAKNVYRIEGSSADIMKFVISGGVTDLENIKIKKHENRN
ncbi:MAG: DUF502 domain-containing protein [Bacteroidia bacterium]|nr:DUF502 domain-containing protein [Bacteroidia bacterium]